MQKSSLLEDNWIMRIITNTMNKKITIALAVAKKFINCKVLLALLTRDLANLWKICQFFLMGADK
jgi:hypothetical protein